MASKKTNVSTKSRQTKQSKQPARKAPTVKNILQKQKGPARDADGKFTSGSGGLAKLKDFNWKRILPVVLVVALVGGFLVYRSFAGNAQLLAVPGSNSGKQECTNAAGTVVKETSGSKRNASVCQLNVGKTIKPIIFGANDVTATANTTEAQFMGNVASKTSATGYYQVCYNVRNAGTAATSVVVGSYTSGNSPSGGTTIAVANTDYASVCDPVSHKSGSTRPFLTVAAGSVRIGSVTIATANAPQTPPPTATNNCKSFPDASCTGTKAGIARSESGSITTSKDGQVIENLNINGDVRVNHSNVIIRNVLIKSRGGNAIYTEAGIKNLLIEDCELNGQRNYNAEPAVFHHDYTMRRCNIYGFGEGPRANNNVTLEGNYIHDFANWVPQGAHADCIQSVGGSNVTIRGNTCIIGENGAGDAGYGFSKGGPWYNNATAWFDGANAAIFFSDGPGNKVLIENNLVGGGTYAVGVDSRYSNVTIRNNQFVTGIKEHAKGGWGGPFSGPLPSGAVLSNNTWYDGPNAGKSVN